MKKLNIITILILLVIFFFMSQNCSNSTWQKDLKINVVWYKAYPKENSIAVKKGIHWYLAFLGATLPKGCFKEIKIVNNQPFEMDFEQFGFNRNAHKAWSKIITEIKESDYYKSHNAIDIGRLIALTLNSTWNYYEIVGVEKNLDNIFSRYQFKEKLYAMQTNESCIALENRKVMLPKDTVLDKLAFVGLEGNGKIVDETFVVTEFEVMEIMPNSFYKFAVYDESGKLLKGSNKNTSKAGKPAKCIWCHEIKVNLPFLAKKNIDGYISIKEFSAIVNRSNKSINNYQKKLETDLIINKQDHSYLERLYISFMEPSISRLAGEWKISEKEVKLKLKDLENHKHHEFGFLGILYNRADVDLLSTFPTIKVASDARETSEYEPNFFKN